MLYLPITKSWILSCNANRLYLVCAFAAISLIGVLLAALLAVIASGAVESSPSALLIMQILLLPGILGTALCIAMWYFWFNFDNSTWPRKAVWFCLLYLLIP